MKGMIQLFAKKCEISERIQKFEALEPRISPNHPIRPTLLKEYKNWLAGYKGEKSLEFHLSMLPDKKYLIFHNIRLLFGKYFFQIDFLILAAAFALEIEVKNRTGEYFFEKYLNQTTLKVSGTHERIKNPVLQARLQAMKLKKWLQKHNFPEIPILHIFVNSNGKASITAERGNEQILRYICNSEGLLEKISQLANCNKNEILNTKELRRVKRLLLTGHTPENFDIISSFHLTYKDIVTGVQCPKCLFLPMDYTYGSWICPNCQCKSKTAHIKAIYDYFLLYKPSITNSELREFLHIESPTSANRILRKLDFTSTGTKKGTIYFLPRHN
ncbi:nuclease-related domain-containing protein [Paenibacillus sp. BSR1-1]|uniref:nuclease-related domain-containing protein n=1 Tax=Paenibacillus sp. BSR1-1 TaxID=3020845 RepID=UPI0025B219DF|nr:nuclease-related domain-containing protein [Paenibacillus sp. BSR1-1]MDN3018020.1 nuclease-related domain-containing protein [Paenibacillus sp. BSR1-1]